ncbi:hypothetical protein KIL84_022166 [Mauremys mutica]|uniref:Uncharacterized protein n=1 Tax=Mauremys mutica TaxID=74926 RepID=A0A9D3X9G3_9SAUR|nr:hypothetical protein KIL84_022166 [Mauremys mutica]
MSTLHFGVSRPCPGVSSFAFSNYRCLHNISFAEKENKMIGGLCCVRHYSNKETLKNSLASVTGQSVIQRIIIAPWKSTPFSQCRPIGVSGRCMAVNIVQKVKILLNTLWP